MNTHIAILVVAIMMRFKLTGALPLSVGIGTEICAATDDNQYEGEAEEDTKMPILAPQNPDFVAYCKNQPDTSSGYIPSPIDLSHLDQLPVERLSGPYTLPSRFDWGRFQQGVLSQKPEHLWNLLGFRNYLSSGIGSSNRRKCGV